MHVFQELSKATLAGGGIYESVDSKEARFRVTFFLLRT
jgi:hypothetical protein